LARRLLLNAVPVGKQLFVCSLPERAFLQSLFGITVSRLSERHEDRRRTVMSTSFSESPPRILLGSDNQRLISGVSHALMKAGFNVDTANDYIDMETLWRQSRQEVVLIEVSHPDSIEPATTSALRIKRQNAQQFIAYLADAALQMSGLTGDAIFSRDTNRLPQALRELISEKT
jgi:CheY-like chemotaxis protein